jgi:hypothetical protein
MTLQAVAGALKRDLQKFGEALAAMLRTLIAPPKPTKRRPF